MRLRCALALAGIWLSIPVCGLPLMAHSGPFDGTRFRGRIAYSADGNYNDEDDWAASPVALAIMAAFGVQDRLVHFDYNCILPKTDPHWEREHAAGVLGAADRYGFQKSVFYDCQQDLDGAIRSIAAAINASSAEDPLYFILAGPMEIPYRGIQRSDPARRQFVYAISHNRWNDGYASAELVQHNKRDVIPLGITWTQIADQNPLLSTSRYGRPARPAEWAPWSWMERARDPRVHFLWTRMRASTRADCSDAGMTYFLLTGDEQADPAKLNALLEEHELPAPQAPRLRVRLEAENFHALDGFAVESVNDRAISQRIIVTMDGGTRGRIQTRFDEPYTHPGGRYNVDIRYLGAGDNRSRCVFMVNGRQQGAAWRPARGDTEWRTHSIAEVPVRTNDEITVAVEGSAGGTLKQAFLRLDYVELSFLGPVDR